MVMMVMRGWVRVAVMMVMVMGCADGHGFLV